MQTSPTQRVSVAPSAAVTPAVTGLYVFECQHDTPGVAIPRPEINLVVRFGPSTPAGLDVHAFGLRQTVHRKTLRTGMRAVTARLHLGATEAVLGVPAAAIAGRVVALEDLWGAIPTRRLYDRLANTRDTIDAGVVLENEIAQRLATTTKQSPRTRLALHAADRLGTASVSVVADELGVSERHLRRAFRETLGVSPKAFARLKRFHRALRTARTNDRATWASIASAAGYYDQAHLIAEFRAIAGATPRALLGELRATPPIG